MTQENQESPVIAASAGPPCWPTDCFMVGASWNLGRYGIRRIESVAKRLVPHPSAERLCDFGVIDTRGGEASLVVGEKTLRSCFTFCSE